MAATSIGLSTVVFGLAAETGVVVQNFTSTETAETTEISKHDGTFSAVAFSNKKINVSLSGNCNDSIGSVGASLTLAANATAVCSGTYHVTDTSYTETSDGFNSFDISATKFPFLST
jgi:hypothetical protein